MARKKEENIKEEREKVFCERCNELKQVIYYYSDNTVLLECNHQAGSENVIKTPENS